MSWSHKPNWTVLLLFALIITTLHAGDENAPAASSSAADRESGARPIRLDVPLVLVNVSVVDSFDRFVTGLERENFQVYEDKKPQQITHFSSEDVPISVGLVFDASGSMNGKIDKARAAVLRFLDTANPADDFFVINFNDRPRKIMDFTSDVSVVQDKLNFTEPKGKTALLDAIYLALHEMRRARHTRKVLLIISDGGDNSSRYTTGDIRRAVKESDVQIYALGIYEPMPDRSRTPEEFAGPSLLSEITEMTGGRQFEIANLDDLPAAARKIGRELRNLYVIGYAPKNDTKDGKWRKIQVKFSLPKGMPPLHLFSKAGYYAPAE